MVVIHTLLGKNSPSYLVHNPLISHLPAGMEDSHAVSLNLDEHQDDASSSTFFAVYDGHGGMEVFL